MVSCEKGGETIWTKGCSGQFSCGYALKDCLEQGGCGTICKKNMVYIPEKKLFYLSDLIEQLIEN